MDAVGSDEDDHGCIAWAGYIWSASEAKCYRSWEETCSDLTTATLGGDHDDNGCLTSTGYS